VLDAIVYMVMSEDCHSCHAVTTLIQQCSLAVYSQSIKLRVTAWQLTLRYAQWRRLSSRGSGHLG